MLVDASRVRKGIAADDGLVRRGREADDLCQLLACGVELFELEVVLDGILIAADAQRGSDFFQRRIACALADAVDGALYLTRSAFNRCQGVGDGQSQIVVAVRGKDHFIRTWHALTDS